MRRNRAKVFEEEQSVDRWLISYADFITLLFAFFVVMYSVSQVNESKYKILSDALTEAFEVRQANLIPIQIGDPSRSNYPVTDGSDQQPEANDEESQEQQSENFASTEEFKDLESGLRDSLGDLIDQELADINSDADWININLRSGLLFPSGSDQLNESADPILSEVVRHINSNRQLLLVHGHTDNIPINTERFPSNWELSSARAVAVVRKLQRLNVEPARMSVEGHGEYQPIADNSTTDGRAKNRRVVVSISRKQAIPPLVEQDSQVASQSQQIEQTSNQAISQKEAEPEFEIVRLPGGGILIRGKELPEEDGSQEEEQQQ